MKVKVFIWYLNREVILTKDNLAKQEIGEVVRIALSVAYRKQSIIYFVSAPMLDFCGPRYICYLESLGLDRYQRYV